MPARRSSKLAVSGRPVAYAPEMVGTSADPGLLVFWAVLAAGGIWRITRLARLVGRSSIVLPSAVGEDAVKVRCGVKVTGAPGEGSVSATWPSATLVIAESRAFVQSPLGDWDFPLVSSTVELTGRNGPFAAPVTLRRGSLIARVHCGPGDTEKVAHALQQHGWLGRAGASDGAGDSLRLAPDARQTERRAGGTSGQPR